MTFFLLDLFAMPRGELLRRDNVDKRKRKKEAYPPAGTSLQGFAHRFNYSFKSVPVGEYLQLLALQTFSHSGTTSATTMWYILAGIIIPAALYLSVFTCREKA